MNITFDGHTPARRQVTINQNQLHRLFEAMREEILFHVEYSSLSGSDHDFPRDKAIRDICKEHGVDFRYKRDRVAFFKALLDGMENPYA